MNRSVRVSSMVDFVPNRAATSACTSWYGCSSNALNSSSVLENAYVCLPVVGLFFIGGSTPNSRSNSANLGLLIRSSFLYVPRTISLAALTLPKCSANTTTSNHNTGSVNILMVRSMSRNSVGGKSPLIALNNAHVRVTSFLQYSPYRASCSAGNASRRSPKALTTSVPLTPRP